MKISVLRGLSILTHGSGREIWIDGRIKNNNLMEKERMKISTKFKSFSFSILFFPHSHSLYLLLLSKQNKIKSNNQELGQNVFDGRWEPILSLFLVYDVVINKNRRLLEHVQLVVIECSVNRTEFIPFWTREFFNHISNLNIIKRCFIGILQETSTLLQQQRTY